MEDLERLKRELAHRHTFDTQEQTRAAIVTSMTSTKSVLGKIQYQ